MILAFAVCLPPFLWLCLHKENSLPLVAFRITRVFKTLYSVAPQDGSEHGKHDGRSQPVSRGWCQLCSLEGPAWLLEENPRGWSLSSQVGEGSWGTQGVLALWELPTCSDIWSGPAGNNKQEETLIPRLKRAKQRLPPLGLASPPRPVLGR